MPSPIEIRTVGRCSQGEAFVIVTGKKKCRTQRKLAYCLIIGVWLLRPNPHSKYFACDLVCSRLYLHISHVCPICMLKSHIDKPSRVILTLFINNSVSGAN